MLGSTALALAGSAFQIGSGIYKNITAKEESYKIPLTTVPESAKTALAESANIAGARSAGATEAERAIKEAGATADYRTERIATSGQQLQAGVSSTQGTTDKQLRALQSAEEEDKTKRKSMYIDQLYKMAEMEKSVEETNKANRYNTEQGIKAAANREMFSGVTGASATGLAAMDNEKFAPAEKQTAAKKVEKVDDIAVDDDLAEYNLYVSTVPFTEEPVSIEEWRLKK